MSRNYLVLLASILILTLSFPVMETTSAPPPYPTITFSPPPWIPLLPITKELRASADSTLFSYYPNNNYGSNHKLAVGRQIITTPSTITLWWETVVSFNVYNEIPPGSEVTSAQLILTVQQPPPSSAYVEVHPLTKSFVESTVTWNSHHSSYGSTITTQTISFDAHDGTKVAFDVTPYIKSKVQTGGAIYGFLLKVPSSTNGGLYFYSREGAPYDSWKPTLKVSYKSSYIDLVTSQTSLQITQGGNANVQLSIGGTFNGQAEITHKWIGSAPSGVNLQLSQTSGKVPFASTLQIQVSNSTSPGQYKLEVKAKNKNGNYNIYDKVTITINVISATQPDFNLSISPATITRVQGEMAEYSITVIPVAGFSGTIHFSVSGIPPGSTYQFVSSGSNIYLRVMTSSSTPPGNYTLTITAQSGGKIHTTSATLTVTTATTTTTTASSTTTTQPSASFFINVNPTSLTLARGDTAHLTVRVQKVGEFSDPVTLSASNLPQGVSISSNINNAPPDFTADVTLVATNQAPLGTRQFTLLATGGGITRSSTITLTISGQQTRTQTQTQTQTRTGAQTSTPTQTQAGFDFSLSVTPRTLTLNPESTGSVAVTVKKVSGSGTVTLSASGLPSDASIRFNPPSLQEGTSSLVIKAGQTTGTFTVVVTGTSGSKRKSATFQLQIKAGESRCIIATAAFGSELDPHVSYLRNFRDNLVMSTYSGSRFITAFNAFYYSWSPQVAGVIRKNNALASFTRLSIVPLLSVLEAGSSLYKVLLPLGKETAMVSTGVIASFLLGLIYLSPLLILNRWERARSILGSRKLLIAVSSLAIASLIALGISIYFTADSIALISSASLVLGMIALAPLTATQVISKLSDNLRGSKS